ncbi:MAG: ferritin-like protein [Ktedonobacteraceae bacterium]|nr:ferritin-like protein [Ktedonobacteraceae bacterium]
MNIQTLADLQNHVQWAIEIEHATIPPYLCALYSLNAQDTNNFDAMSLIQDVVVDEMLHLALGCNLLNAIGGSPTFNNPSFIPKYPSSLPHHSPQPPLIIHLEKCSVDLVKNTFLEIEKPEPTVHDIPEGDNYMTIGQFYAAVSQGFVNLNKSLGPTGLFKGDTSKQATQILRVSGGPHGNLIKVVDLSSAQQAITEIVQQGEGSPQTMMDPDGDLAHYWEFKEIADGTVALGQVYPMIQDPTTAGLPAGSPVQKLSQLFNDCYSLLLRTMTHVFNTGDNSPLVDALYILMRQILPLLATLLMQTPIPNKHGNAGSSFEFSTTAQRQIIQNSKALEKTFPQLSDVSASLMSLPAIDGK